MLTKHLLVPLIGSCREDPDKDSYNFYLLQLRIRIEMSFGPLTTNKWQCLRRKLKSSLENSAKLLEACARLHNYILDCKIQKEGVAIRMRPDVRFMPCRVPPLDGDICPL
jgi:hypothetical protein